MPSSNIKRKKKPGPINNAPSNGGGGNYTETAMDEYLARLDLYRKPIAKDGSCLFRAVSEQVYNCQAKHLQVRKDCIDFMRRNRDKFEAFLEGPFDHHLFRLQNPKEWAGQVEISALSLMYKKDFVVYQAIDAEPTKVTDNNFKDKIMLCYSNGNHYDAVYDIRFQKDAAVCQSLVYEILYQKVFTELDRKDNTSKGPSKQNPTNDVNSVMTSYYQNGLGEDDTFKEDNEDNAGWTEVVRGRSNKAKSARQNRGYDQEDPKEEPMKPNLDQKHGWQAKRSLDNELYRNVELEVWEDSKNAQEQQDQSYAASIQYQSGDKCFAWLGQPDVGDKVYEAIVKYYLPVQGNIEVQVPELGNKCFVIPLENLKPNENQQELNYRDLSGFYKKSEAGGGPPGNSEGLRDDGKRGRRRNIQGRPPRGYKGDEHGEDTAARKGFQDDSFARPRSGPGPRDKFGRGRGRGRYQRGRDERQLQREDEEARQMAEQAKLAELQGKDPAAFPALPTQQAEEKPASTEATPDQSPAEFWSRLKNTQGKPPATLKENHVNATENKPPSTPTSPTSQQQHTAKPEEKELETKKERPQAKEVKAAGAQNSEAVNKLVETKVPDASSNHVPLETSKKEQNESQKQALPLEKESSKGKVELSKGLHSNEIKQQAATVSSSAEVKNVPLKSNVEDVKFADAIEARNVWVKEPAERKELKTQNKTPENSIKEIIPDLKKPEEPPTVKPQGVRGVIRMTNLNNKPQQATDSEEQEETQKEDIKLLRKEDFATKEVPNLKSALAGESSASSTPEKKTVTFAEPLKEGGEIKVLVSTAKDLAGKDGKREVLAPPTLVSVVMKPAPASEIAQDSLSVSLMPSNKPDKNTGEDDASNAKNSTPNQDTNTKPQAPTTIPPDSNQGSEGAEPVPSSSPSVSQHQASYQLPYLSMMYGQLPNMTSTPRMPQGISMESDGSDLPEDPNTLRYFFNLGFQYHIHLNQQQQQWANQQMMYYPSMYQMTSQDHMQPHPAVSMGQQLNPAVPQVIYQAQQMQAYHAAQIPPVMQDNTSFSERNSLDRSSPGQTQQQQQQPQQQQQQQQQQPIPYQTPPFVPNQHWRAARSMTGYQGKQMHMGGYNSQVPNQQTPRGPMQQGAGNTKPHYKTKKYPKHRNEQFMYGSQSQHAQNQGAHGAHAYPNASQAAGSSSSAFFLTGGDHAAGKGSGDYYHSNQQFVNFHGNVSSSMTQAPHSAANSRGQYP